jgi:heme exporter protein A
MTGATARLCFDSVACLRGTRLLFEGLSFALGPGDAALLTGPNGAGKSSLLRIAAGLLDASAGEVAREGSLALANEAAALDPQPALGDALAFWARIDGRGPADVARGLAAMGIEGLAEVPVRMLSTGQRKRAALALTIAGGADLWLLDEPGNGLDSASLDRLAAAMAAHRAVGGIVVAASHQPLGLADALPIRLGEGR